jgi:hypothetical protein
MLFVVPPSPMMWRPEAVTLNSPVTVAGPFIVIAAPVIDTELVDDVAVATTDADFAPLLYCTFNCDTALLFDCAPTAES